MKPIRESAELDWEGKHMVTVATQAQHSPLPWVKHQEGRNVAGWPIWVVFTPESALAKIHTYGEGDHPGQAEANAEFIVRACNNVERLARICKAMAQVGVWGKSSPILAEALSAIQEWEAGQ